MFNMKLICQVKYRGQLSMKKKKEEESHFQVKMHDFVDTFSKQFFLFVLLLNLGERISFGMRINSSYFSVLTKLKALHPSIYEAGSKGPQVKEQGKVICHLLRWSPWTIDFLIISPCKLYTCSNECICHRTLWGTQQSFYWILKFLRPLITLKTIYSY